MLKKPLFLTAVLLVVLSAVALRVSSQQNTQFGMPFYPAWLNSPSNEISVSQLTRSYSAHNLALELPTWLPSGFTLTSVHVPNVNNPFSFTIVTYSGKGITDFRYAEIVFQIVPGEQPSPTELSAIRSNSHGSLQLLAVTGIPVLLNPQAVSSDPAQKQFGPAPYAMFWKDKIYYQLRVYAPLTTDDVLRMIGSLEPAS